MTDLSLEKVCCYNYSCENILTQFELDRLSFKFTKWIFCRRCRFGRHNIDLIRCKYCQEPMPHNGKIVCEDCKKERIKQTQRNKHIQRMANK